MGGGRRLGYREIDSARRGIFELIDIFCIRI
jgi:hypothetical protein